MFRAGATFVALGVPPGAFRQHVAATFQSEWFSGPTGLHVDGSGTRRPADDFRPQTGGVRRADDLLPVESELAALLADGHSRTRATELVIERAVADAVDATTVVLLEGVSDQIALEVVASRLGRTLRDEGVAIVPMGGATNIGRFLSLFGRSERDVRLAGLYDVAEEPHFLRALGSALGRHLDRTSLRASGFFACDADIEDELLRSLGPAGVEAVIKDAGELASFRTMQREPFHRARTHEQQLHRFVGHDRYVYARLLAAAVEIDRIPPPLESLLAYV